MLLPTIDFFFLVSFTGFCYWFFFPLLQPAWSIYKNDFSATSMLSEHAFFLGEHAECQITVSFLGFQVLFNPYEEIGLTVGRQESKKECLELTTPQHANTCPGLSPGVARKVIYEGKIYTGETVAGCKGIFNSFLRQLFAELILFGPLHSSRLRCIASLLRMLRL